MESFNILNYEDQAGKANGDKITVSRPTGKIEPTNGNSHSPEEGYELTALQKAVGMIIHEIRNPLTAISLANQSLREEIHDDNLPSSFNIYTDIVGKNIMRIETLLIE